MPRYFFHVHNDLDTFDDEGLELADDGAARRSAVDAARAIAADSVRDGSLNLNHTIEIVGADGRLVEVMRFGAAVAVTS